MQVKYVVSFGCSWTWGDELNPETREQECFTGLIARHYNALPLNFGDNGTSQNTARTMFLEFLKHRSEYVKDSLFLIGLTNSHRWSWVNNAKKIIPPVEEDRLYNPMTESTDIRSNVVPEPKKDWEQLYKLHYMHNQCTYQDKLNHANSLHLFDGIAARNNLKLVQFNYFECVQDEMIPTLINNGYPVQFYLRESKKDVFAEHGHPNALGHKIIAEELLIPEIERLYGN